MPEPTLQERLKKALSDVKTLDVTREKLARDASVEEHKATESITRLKELGVLNAAKLSIEELEALLAKTNRGVETKLATVEQKVNEANGVLAEYNAVVTSTVA